MTRIGLDDTGLSLVDEGAVAVEQTLSSLAQSVDRARACGFDCSRVSWAFEIQSATGVPLWSRLFEDPDLDRDITTFFSQTMDQMQTLDDWVPTLAVHDCGGASLENAPGIAAVAANPDIFAPGLVTGIQTGRSGSIPVVLEDGDSPVDLEFVNLPDHVLGLARMLLRECGEADMPGLAAIAFPAIRFADHIWSQTNRFVGGLGAVRSQLLLSLAGLNDFAPRVFADETQSNNRIAKLASYAGITISPESPRTHRNRSAMAERDAEFEGSTIRCEWHVKLHPTHNRIHFAVAGATVFVGLFADHLTV